MNHSNCILEIDLSVIKNNYKKLCELSSSTVAASVKANCYGLGTSFIASALKEVGCRDFFVSSSSEGVILRKALGDESNIYVLHGVFLEDINIFLQHKLIPVLNHSEQINLWEKQAIYSKRKLPCLIHIDTGMHRLGMNLAELESFDINKYSNLHILYVMSHLSSAEDINNPSNKNQLEKFKKYTEKLPNIKRSLANSSGIFLGPEYHFDMVRSGAALYGINPTSYSEQPHIKNPVKLLAPIIQLSELPIGQSIGYNGTYINNSKKSCRIATLPIGYADGFLRGLSNKANVFLDGIKLPVIGRVSMDLISVDVSDVPEKNLFLGAMIEIIGSNSTPEDLAKIAGTNAYEILTMLGDRFKKIYTHNNSGIK